MAHLDLLCPISGLSLRTARATHIALVWSNERFLPLTLPITGQYDRSGTITATPDLRADLFVAGFARLAAAGRLDVRGVPDEHAAFTRAPAIDRLLRLFERVCTRPHLDVHLMLDRFHLRQALIHADIFAVLAPAPAPPRVPTSAELADLLARALVAPQARELLAPAVDGTDELRATVAAGLAQLAALARWLELHGRAWSSSAGYDVFDAENDLLYVRDARLKLAAAPELWPVLDHAAAELEHEYAHRPAPWWKRLDWS